MLWPFLPLVMTQMSIFEWKIQHLNYEYHFVRKSWPYHNIWLKTYSINCFLATSSKRPIRNNGSKRISLLSSWVIQRKFHWSRMSIASSVGTRWIKLLSWHFRSRFSKRNIQTTTPACGNLSDSTQEVEQTFNIIKKRLWTWLLKIHS